MYARKPSQPPLTKALIPSTEAEDVAAVGRNEGNVVQLATSGQVALGVTDHEENDRACCLGGVSCGLLENLKCGRGWY